MAQGDLSDFQRKYAKECLQAAKRWPKRHLSAEQMRQQVQRNHAEVMKRKKEIENTDVI